MKAIWIVSLVLVAIAPISAFADLSNVNVKAATEVMNPADVGHFIKIIGPVAGKVESCGEVFTSGYEAYVWDVLGQDRVTITLWGNGLKGTYRIASLEKGAKLYCLTLAPAAVEK
jgi:hypothetical protein